MEKVKQTIDKIIHPKDHPSSTTDATGTHSTTGATHGSGVAGTHGTAGTHGAHGTHGTTGLGSSTHSSTTAGPHDSNLANKADPRVDSDLDGSRNAGAAQYGTGAHNTHGTSGLGSSTHAPGTGLGSSTHGSTNAGPHSSNTANYVDPRVDSDRDGSSNFGAAQYGPGAHNTTHGTTHGTTGFGSSHTTGTHTGTSGSTQQSHATGKSIVPEGLQRKLPESVERAVPNAIHDTSGLPPKNTSTGNSGAYGSAGTHGTTGLGSSTHGTYGSTNTGPHDSNLLNKADPRVDSDLDGSRNVGAAQYGAGAHNTHGTAASGFGHSDTARSTTAGPHSSNIANKLDPRVDSDLSKSGAHGTHGTSGLGSNNTGYGTTGSTNTGPHDSNLLNKTDPRVDSDFDGSRNAGAAQYGAGAHNTSGTTGGTFGTGHTGTTGTHTEPLGKPSLLDKLNPKVDADHDGKAGFMK